MSNRKKSKSYLKCNVAIELTRTDACMLYVLLRADVANTEHMQHLSGCKVGEGLDMLRRVVDALASVLAMPSINVRESANEDWEHLH